MDMTRCGVDRCCGPRCIGRSTSQPRTWHEPSQANATAQAHATAVAHATAKCSRRCHAPHGRNAAPGCKAHATAQPSLLEDIGDAVTVPVGANDEGIRAPVVVQVEAHGGHGRATDNSGGAVPAALVPGGCVAATKRPAPADNSGGTIPASLVPSSCVTATKRTAPADNSGGAVPTADHSSSADHRPSGSR